MIRFLLLFSTFFLLTTCAMPHINAAKQIPVGYKYETERTVKYLPRDSFIHVYAYERYEFCYTVKNEKKCITLKRGGASSGSGFVVYNTPNGSLVITAYHVCSATSKKMTQTLTLTSLDGDEFEARIVATDENKENDICMIYAEDLKKPPVKIALNKPLPGAKLFNLAAPAGIFNEGMVPILEGRYNGVSFKGSAMYSIPAAGGSSGSMVLNNNFELIGLIHSLHIKFPNITVGPEFEIITKFIRKNIKNYSNL